MGAASVLYCQELNAKTIDGLGPREWFRHSFNETLHKVSLGGETFAESLYHVLGGRSQDPPVP